jgi:hypothetical protein
LHGEHSGGHHDPNLSCVYAIIRMFGRTGVCLTCGVHVQPPVASIHCVADSAKDIHPSAPLCEVSTTHGRQDSNAMDENKLKV